MKRPLPQLEVFLEHLRALPFVLEAKARSVARLDRDEGADAWLSVRTAAGIKTFAVQLKRSHLIRETADSIVHQARDHPNVLVLAPIVGRELGRRFQQGHVNFLDQAGNCYINLDDQYVARIQGQLAHPTQASDRGLRAAAYRVIFALLVEPTLIGSTTRDVASQAGGVSPQTVSDVRHRLFDRGLVLRTRGCYRWAPGKFGETLDLWITGCTTTLWPRLLLGRFRSRLQEPGALERDLGPLLSEVGPWRWGGGAAAMRLTSYYRGDRTVVYFGGEPPADVGKRLRLVPDDRGSLALARSPGPLAFRGPRSETVHPLLVYTDLLAEGNDRASEAAEVLRQRYLIEPGIDR